MWHQKLAEYEKEHPEHRQDGQQDKPRTLMLTDHRNKAKDPANKSTNETEHCPAQDTIGKDIHNACRRQLDAGVRLNSSPFQLEALTL